MGAGHLLVLQGSLQGQDPGRGCKRYKFSVGTELLRGFPGRHLSYKPKGMRDREVQTTIFLLPALLTLNPCELGKQIKI